MSYDLSFSQVKGQRESRRLETFRDQHGRLYQANVEISTGDPCEVVQPLDGWRAPVAPDWASNFLFPPEDCLGMVPARERARVGYQIRVDYDRWLQKWDAAFDTWTARLVDFVHGMKGVDIEATVNDPPPAVRQIIGPAPFPPREFIEAAAAGNAWALGLTPDMPKKAQALVEEIGLKAMIARRRASASRGPSAAGIADPFAEETEGAEAEVAALSRFHDPLADLDLSSEEPKQKTRGRKAALTGTGA